MRSAAWAMASASVSLPAFFFSSRRRHTRYWRDWSSDVCSSDLQRVEELAEIAHRLGPARELAVHRVGERERDEDDGGDQVVVRKIREQQQHEKRSEERRVGKECRSGWSP